MRMHPRAWLAVAVVAVVAGGWVAVSAGDDATLDDDTAVDVLTGHDWTHFAGATVGPGGVRIVGLGERIVRQDGSGGQPDPPVNLRGPRLAVRGPMEIIAGVDRPAGRAAVFSLYGDVPVVYDEWRHNPPGLAVTVTDGELRLAVWDGRGDDPAVRRRTTVTAPGAATITVTRAGGRLTVRLGDAGLSVTDPGVFSSGRVFFGADVDGGGPAGWTLTSLRAAGLDGGSVTVVDAPALGQPAPEPGSLRVLAAARRALPIGAAVAAEPLLADDGYRRLTAAQFSMLTTENAMKPQFVHPQPDRYDFTGGDLLVDFAAANGIAVHAHTLVFGEANPRWMQDTPADRRERIMLDHISTVVGHYRGRVAEWDVVNEPLSPDGEDYEDGGAGLRRHLWQQAMGETYIDKAFVAARSADPGAKLYLNDFGLEADGERWDALLSLVGRLKQRGVPVDGVGFEAHIHEAGDRVTAAVLQDHFADLARLGLSARVSEIDVYGDAAAGQAEQYATALTACLAAPNCTSYTTWGVSDRYGSTTESGTYPPQLGDDLIFDRNLAPKAAFTALTRVLRG
ncbi:glycosyl hydrolase [Actinoplanes sp. SE50]|uniref:endo-1,4-beta-xylanase n=1 Tax=unclassified Actinoplanes TaxID=2626549 RepID=UPI00023EC7E0|nr:MULTISPECIES: endo-1,4-beta-xylanase [unclassified Actinoplanes]AEV84736.1 endo-1,4-beta-xylanase [Actinoplanes sp. SE50/110]ATO83128.1 glycosyl hydrolase [Actinoplanes sp. SE50]SLM00535.1 glycosyl hydrolase [Actinoplanes sp. SE50/110]